MFGFTEEQIRRYSRQIILPDVGGKGQRKLLESRVLLIGAGGLGSPAGLYLAAAGVGTLGFVDFDVVDISNLHRQILHTTEDVGRSKTQSAAETVQAINPDVVIMQHCDGAVAPILGEWIEVGLEVFNPVQPNVPGHEPQDLKSQFGDRLSFWGAIDQQNLLPFGTPEQIEADVAEKIQILGAGGGYMCSPAHIIQSDTSMASVEAFIAAAKKHGAYD